MPIASFYAEWWFTSADLSEPAHETFARLDETPLQVSSAVASSPTEEKLMQAEVRHEVLGLKRVDTISA